MNSIPADPRACCRPCARLWRTALLAGWVAASLFAAVAPATPARASEQEAGGVFDLLYDWLMEPTRSREEEIKADTETAPARAVERSPASVAVVTAAETAIEEERLDDAIASLHKHLVDYPSDAPANLAIAQAFYQKAEISFLGLEDILARRHYRRALATDLPPETEKEVERRLREIRRRQRLWLRAGAGIIPAPDESESEFGIIVRGGGTYRYPLGDTAKLQFDLTADIRDFAQKEDDEQRLFVRVGPRFQVTPDTRVTLLATNRQFWTAGYRESFDFGARVEVNHRYSNIVDLTGGASWARRTRVDLAEQAAIGRKDHYVETGGDYKAIWFRPHRRLSPTVRVHGTLGADVESTSRIWDRLQRARIGAGARIQLPRGFTIGGSFEIRRLRFTETPRRTTEYFVRGSILNRQIRILGFSPELVLNVTEKRSNLPLADSRDYGGIIRFDRQL